jgi:hypothetical protein
MFIEVENNRFINTRKCFSAQYLPHGLSVVQYYEADGTRHHGNVVPGPTGLDRLVKLIAEPGWVESNVRNQHCLGTRHRPNDL